MEWTPRMWIAIGVIVVGALVVGVIAALTLGGGSSQHTVTGTLDVVDPGAKVANSTCTLTSNFDDLHAGTPVKITDEHKAQLGTGTLSNAKVMPGNREGGACEFTFFVTNVPTADTYNVQIGDCGSVAYSHSTMVDHGWAVSMKVS